MLRDVAVALEKRNILYCLDGGTLLGVVRENRLLPWDYDLDMFVTADDFKKAKTIIWSLRSRGYWASVRYHKVSRPPLKVRDPRVIKIRNRKYGLFAGPVKLDIFIKYRVNDHYHWMEGSGKNSVNKKSPTRYFSRLTKIEFDGHQYTIPEGYDEYLTSRYKDWRVPIKEWNHLKDDHAIERM